LKRFLLIVIALGALGAGAWFAKERLNLQLSEPAPTATPAPAPTASPSPSPTPVIAIKELPVTLPVIDALFFADPGFAAGLKSKLQLTDEQVAELRRVAREETAGLKETGDDSPTITTTAAGERAATKVAALVGDEKARQVAEFALERYSTVAGSGNDTIALSEEPTPLPTLAVPSGTPSSGTPLPTETPLPSPSPTGAPAARTTVTPSPPFSAPADTRIVVNAPAYRMDVFQNGQLVKSYKIGIGYPEFPLPTGMRRASQIIFNPTWTPPDEPWVESSSKVKVGERIAAGDKLNPLGVIKIPIGLPSLIHGGKQPSKIGGFASHGCVGMTDKQVQSFAKVLAQIGGADLTDEEIAKRAQNRKETKVVKLKTPVPVELRYETMMVEDGKLHIYRDVYDRGTNVKENLEALLETHGVSLSDLSPQERTQALAALAAMSSKSARPGGPAAPAQLTAEQKAEQRAINIARQQLSSQIKGRKEIVIDVAALADKGYPAPADLDAGSAPKPEAKPVKKTGRK